LAHHKDGRLAEAERLYLAVLANAPRHFDALHLLGLVRYQTGEHAVALEIIDRAIAINPNVAFAHSNRGLALQALHRLHDALAAFDRALKLKPELVEALYNRGNVLRELKRPNEALVSYNAALGLKPDYFEARINRGNTHWELNNTAEAFADFQKALVLSPNSVD